MATLVLTALGTAVGGPLGGALGSLLGNTIDRSVIGGRSAEGPRLRELTATTSSYGSAVPRHFGRVRAAGTVIWATDLVESSERSGGGKGRPATTSYSYTASFAVALASRPIHGIGRIWADGKLLRGAAGDLKVGGELRIYSGHGNQLPDPLVAADRGPDCPAFRGLAYCVFESLQLGEFGNRIPALTFEIIADEGPVALDAILSPARQDVVVSRSLDPLLGISDEGGTLSDLLSGLNFLFPLACDAGGNRLSIRAADIVPEAPLALPEPATFDGEDGFAPTTGMLRRRQSDARAIPSALRYYDGDRDYQPGMQRVDGRARPGAVRTLELPGVFEAGAARALINHAAECAEQRRDRLSWRVADLDPALGPGSIVTAPGVEGIWLVDSWEWRDQGIELELSRIPAGASRSPVADPGDSLNAEDLESGPTHFAAFELPWDGMEAPDQQTVFAALSSPSPGWKGAALFAQRSQGLVSIAHSGPRRMTMGKTALALPAANALRFSRHAQMEVQLAATEANLASASLDALANGANRALVGRELLQFAQARHLGAGLWRLTGLLRGRGGTEAETQADLPAGAPFVLIDENLLRLEGLSDDVDTLAALGLSDVEPVTSPIINRGIMLAPLSPVHPDCSVDGDGGLSLRWTRRARGAWSWPDAIDTPLNEQTESCRVGVGNPASPDLWWQTAESALTISPPDWATITANHAGAPLWVRQVGSHGLSPPLLLLTISAS